MKILNTKEFDYLYNFVEPFHHRVNYIEKIAEPTHDSQEKYEAIRMEILGESGLLKLPTFNAGAYYKDMELNKKYSLQVLGIVYPTKTDSDTDE